MATQYRTFDLSVAVSQGAAPATVNSTTPIGATTMEEQPSSGTQIIAGGDPVLWTAVGETNNSEATFITVVSQQNVAYTFTCNFPTYGNPTFSSSPELPPSVTQVGSISPNDQNIYNYTIIFQASAYQAQIASGVESARVLSTERIARLEKGDC